MREIDKVFRRIKEIEGKMPMIEAGLKEASPELAANIKSDLEWNHLDLHYNKALYNHLAGMVVFDEVKGCSCSFCLNHPV